MLHSLHSPEDQRAFSAAYSWKSAAESIRALHCSPKRKGLLDENGLHARKASTARFATSLTCLMAWSASRQIASQKVARLAHAVRYLSAGVTETKLSDGSSKLSLKQQLPDFGVADTVGACRSIFEAFCLKYLPCRSLDTANALTYLPAGTRTQQSRTKCNI